MNYQLGLDRDSPFFRTFTFGYCNGCIGYVPTEDAFSEGGYEVSGAFRHYGTLMIKPESEQLIKTTTLAMLGDLRQA